MNIHGRYTNMKSNKRETITARWWNYVGNGWVRMALKDGRSVRWHSHRSTEEGWSYEAHIWTRVGDEIYEEISTGGQDCDGRLDRCSTWVTTLDNLAVNEPFSDALAELPEGTRLPAWEPQYRSQYDQFAEMAGY